MSKKKIKNEGQGEIFRNPFLEFLTKAPAPVSATLYVGIVAGLLYVGFVREIVSSVITGALIFIGAMFFWTFFEYIFHRYINHIDEYFPESKLAHRIAYTLHGIHHEYPRDRERLMMPPVPGLLIVGVLYIVFYSIMGEYVYLFMPGFMTGYIIYSSIHIAIHKSNVPSFLKTQYRHHAIHHYKYPEKAFGVSTTIWDRVFGTMPPES